MGIANNRPFKVFLWLGPFTLYRKFRGPALPRHQLLCYVQEWALLYLTKTIKKRERGMGLVTSGDASCYGNVVGVVYERTVLNNAAYSRVTIARVVDKR